MTTLETISTVIAAVAAILGGVWFILGKVFKMGVTAARRNGGGFKPMLKYHRGLKHHTT